MPPPRMPGDEPDRGQEGQDQADPGALADAPLAELLGLDLALVVEDEDADRVELDVLVDLVPGLEALDRRVRGGLVLEDPEDDSCVCHVVSTPFLRRVRGHPPTREHRWKRPGGTSSGRAGRPGRGSPIRMLLMDCALHQPSMNAGSTPRPGAGLASSIADEAARPRSWHGRTSGGPRREAGSARSRVGAVEGRRAEAAVITGIAISRPLGSERADRRRPGPR